MSSSGEHGKPGEPAKGSVGGRGGEGGRGGQGEVTGGSGGVGGEGGDSFVVDSVGDIKERLSTAAFQIKQHVDNAQSELNKLRAVVDDLDKRLSILEHIELHRND